MAPNTSSIPFSQTAGCVSSRAARPMLSLVMTRLIMSCEPRAASIASLLNSTKYLDTRRNLPNAANNARNQQDGQLNTENQPMASIFLHPPQNTETTPSVSSLQCQYLFQVLSSGTRSRRQAGHECLRLGQCTDKRKSGKHNVLWSIGFTLSLKYACWPSFGFFGICCLVKNSFIERMHRKRRLL